MNTEMSIEIVPTLGKLIGMTIDEMEEVTKQIQSSIGLGGNNMFADIIVASATFDQKSMFAGAALYAYLISPLLDENCKA